MLSRSRRSTNKTGSTMTSGREQKPPPKRYVKVV
jgi:hypothetical protein